MRFSVEEKGNSVFITLYRFSIPRHSGINANRPRFNPADKVLHLLEARSSQKLYSSLAPYANVAISNDLL
jgi:hypothetical protein